MGEAKRKKQSFERAKVELISSSDGALQIVGITAITLFERFIMPKKYTGGCYLTTMVLHKFLLLEHGIHTTPIIGFVNDGTDNIFMSHAWLEYDGRKTDLTLHLTEHPDIQLQGQLLVLDHTLLSGQATYSYHHHRPAHALVELERLRQNPTSAPIVEHKEIEHLEMLARSKNKALMQAYLDAAPSEFSYTTMTAMLPKSL